MNWSAQSPDLNPIDQIWELLDRSILNRYKGSEKQVWKNLQKVWFSLTPVLLKRYIFSMRHRCLAVIEAKGDHTKYWQLMESSYYKKVSFSYE